MDLEWEVYHQLLQSQDNFASAAGEEDSAGPPAMPSYDPYKHHDQAGRGKAQTRLTHKSGGRTGSVNAGCRQAASRAQRKRQIQSDELKEHVHQEKLAMGKLEQTATTEELHCVQRRYTANKGVWYLQGAEMDMWRRQQHQGVHGGGDDMAD